MSQAPCAYPDSVRNFNTISLTGFTVEVLTNGVYRTRETRLGEPEIFPTEACAVDVAEALAIHLNTETRVRSLATGEIIGEPSDADLDAMWLAQRRLEADEAERRDLARRRCFVTDLVYGEAA